MLDPSELKTDDLLDEIHRQRELAREENEAAARERKQIETIKSEWQIKLEGIEEERIRIWNKHKRTLWMKSNCCGRN
jgi:DNA mismatch repair protein MutS2